jgi:glycosyltransferase involved in cell wall biosynthesis
LAYPLKPLRLLVFDDQIPVEEFGYGYPRSSLVLRTMAALGASVSFFPLQIAKRYEPHASRLESIGVKIVGNVDGNQESLTAFFNSNCDEYDAYWISRPSNLRILLPFLQHIRSNKVLVYDAEALNAVRKSLRFQVMGKPHSTEQAQLLLSHEIELIGNADIVVSVSAREANLLQSQGLSRVYVLSHAHDCLPTEKSFQERRGVLFVAGFLTRHSPNYDAVKFFLELVVPSLMPRLQCNMSIVGWKSDELTLPKEATSFGTRIKALGGVTCLHSYYNDARLCVIPTRFAAGIPWKLTEALAHGVPTVVTSVVAEQLGIGEPIVLVARNEREFAEHVYRCYTDQRLWSSLRDQAIRYADNSLRGPVFTEQLRTILLAISKEISGRRFNLVSDIRRLSASRL